MEFVNAREEKWEMWAVRGCVFLLALGAVVFVVLLMHFAWPNLLTSQQKDLPQIRREVIGRGPLSLGSTQPTSIFQDVMLIGVDTRPGSQPKGTFALRSSGERKEVEVGTTWVLENEIVVQPTAWEKGKLLCQIHEGAVQTSIVFFPSLLFSKSLKEEVYVQQLGQSLIWGPDLFLAGWGGEKFRPLAKQNKVSIGTDVFFLHSGDCLSWRGDKWIVGRQGNDPIAQLHKGTDGFEFQVWDETGFYIEKVKVAMPPVKTFQVDLKTYIEALRPRAKGEVSCLLGKRRALLKEGDWWLRSDSRWKHIRTTADLEACLYHKTDGELFLFETVDVMSGKVVIKGHAFNRMRTAMTPIQLVVPIPTKKKRKP